MSPKILFILHIPPPIHGAAMVGQHIKNSSIINGSFHCRYINLGISATVNEIGKNGIGKIIRYFSILWQVFVQLITFKPQLCYLTTTSQGIGFYKDIPAVLLSKLFGLKVVYHFHNKGVSQRQNKFFDNLLYRLVFKNADVILLSKYLYPDIQKYVSEDRVHYCSNGIPELEAPSPKHDGRSSEAVKILFLSNLIESKGVFVLLEACEILQNKQLAFQCTFVGGIGDVSEQQFNSKVEELELSQSVNYAGKKYGAEKEAAFAQADIFVHPTLNDCVPLVILEAMQNYLPVVSTFEGGIPDLVENGKTGFLVPQKDALALAEKLEQLIINPTMRQQMGAAGRAKYEKQFTLKTFENQLKKILNEIINT